MRGKRERQASFDFHTTYSKGRPLLAQIRVQIYAVATGAAARSRDAVQRMRVHQCLRDWTDLFTLIFFKSFLKITD